MHNQTIYPKKLQRGSHIRVIAPSRSLSIISDSIIDLATKRLEQLGLEVSIASHAMESTSDGSPSVMARIQDLHEAFADPAVDAIFTAIGGYNAVELLSSIDYDLIRNNPKILCGFSDISILSNAIYARTGVVGYSGPHFSSWGMEKGFDYTASMAKNCLFGESAYPIISSVEWSDDPWFIDQENRLFIQNSGMLAVTEGAAEGTIIGGHLRCLAALQGTTYWPSLKNTILFLEEDEETTLPLFNRMLHSLCHQPDFAGVKGIVIGRFQTESKISADQLYQAIKNNPLLSHLPAVIAADIGHTTPIATFPIGGQCSISATSDNVSVLITKH